MSVSGLRAAASPGLGPRGELELVIADRAGRSVATHQFHRGALRVLRPHYLDASGQVCYVLVNPGGAYLGADTYVMDVDVEDGAKLLLTTQSATKVYRTPGTFAEQRMRLRLGEGAQVELAPDQLIAYREASYRQHTHVTVRPSSSLIIAEVVTPGWSPSGTPFGYEELRLRTEIRVETGGETGPESGAESGILAVDNVLIRPPLDDVTGLGFLEGFSHLGSLIVVDPRVDQDLVNELHAKAAGYDAHSGVSLAASRLGTAAMVLRSLSDSTDGLNRLLRGAADLLRERWYGQAPLDLRKY